MKVLIIFLVTSMYHIKTNVRDHGRAFFSISLIYYFKKCFLSSLLNVLYAMWSNIKKYIWKANYGNMRPKRKASFAALWYGKLQLSVRLDEKLSTKLCYKLCQRSTSGRNIEKFCFKIAIYKNVFKENNKQ